MIFRVNFTSASTFIRAFHAGSRIRVAGKLLGTQQLPGNGPATFLDPESIAEVVGKSTAGADRGRPPLIR